MTKSTETTTPNLTKKEAAAFLNCSTRTIESLAATGKIRPIRITPRLVRYDRDDLERLVAESKSA